MFACEQAGRQHLQASAVDIRLLAQINGVADKLDLWFAVYCSWLLSCLKRATSFPVLSFNDLLRSGHRLIVSPFP
jgi:hypothetical protein